jgi:hypothetical protein
MKITYSEKALEAIEAAPSPVQKAFFKQAHFLVDDLHHPSLKGRKVRRISRPLASPRQQRLALLLHHYSRRLPY